MRFSTFATFAIFGAAIAAPTQVEREVSLVQRDYATISSVLANVQDKTNTLDSKIKAFTGTQAQVSDVQAASDAVLSAINNGNSAIQASSSVTLAEAYKIAQQSDALAKVVNTTVDDAIAKKSTAVTAKAGGKVYKAFNDQKSAATTLVNTIKSKVPTDAQSIAESKGKAITDALQRGVNAYADQAGK